MDKINNWPLFIAAQIVGLISLGIVAFSFQQKNRRKMLAAQTISSILGATQFALLGAWSGCLVCLAACGRNYAFSRRKSGRTPLAPLAIYLLAIVVLTIVTYEDLFSLLPMLAYGLYGSVAWRSTPNSIRRADIIACLIMFAYITHVFAFTSLISNTIELVSSAIGLYRNRKQHSTGRRQQLTRAA